MQKKRFILQRKVNGRPVSLFRRWNALDKRRNGKSWSAKCSYFLVYLWYVI